MSKMTNVQLGKLLALPEKLQHLALIVFGVINTAETLDPPIGADNRGEFYNLILDFVESANL